MDREPIITLREVRYVYETDPEQTDGPGTPDTEQKPPAPQVAALDGISLTIARGSFTAVLGQNGSGKSTLARHLNALLLPTEGRVFVAGFDTQDEAHLWDVRRTAGMVFQNPDNQLVSAVVEDDVAFGPENLGIDPAEIRTRVDEALASVEMGPYRKKAPHHLSGGQKMRIAIAGVVAMRPACIVFDEPTAMLDPRGRRDIMDIIGRLHAEGITVVLITHFMEEAAAADRIIVLDRGRVLLDGSPRNVFAQAEVLRGAGLTVPLAVELRERLRALGVPVPDTVISMEEMERFICQYR